MRQYMPDIMTKGCVKNKIFDLLLMFKRSPPSTSWGNKNFQSPLSIGEMGLADRVMPVLNFPNSKPSKLTLKT